MKACLSFLSQKVETGDPRIKLAGDQQALDLINRPCLKRIRWRVMEAEYQHGPRHTHTHTHQHTHACPIHVSTPKCMCSHHTQTHEKKERGFRVFSNYRQIWHTSVYRYTEFFTPGWEQLEEVTLLKSCNEYTQCQNLSSDYHLPTEGIYHWKEW